ncbi:MAG: S41 family peptidase [Burkholderiaceae bacterium]
MSELPPQKRAGTRLNRWRLALCAVLVGAGLSACLPSIFNDDDDYDADNDAEFVVRYMKDWYLWEDRLPNDINEADYSSGQAALDALKVAEDRYSGITPAAEYNRFFRDGQTVGFGLSYRIEEGDQAIRVVLVQPQAPAQEAGLRRGDLITEVEGEAVSTLIAEDRLNAAFGPLDEGVTRSFAITRDGNTLSLTIVKALYNLSYVIADAMFEAGGRKVGYVNFFSFAEKGVAPWQSALDRLLEEGAQDLIVDLRSNGGGLLSVTQRVGSSLGANSLRGKVLAELTFNNRRDENNRTYKFGIDSRSGQFERLVWLTSRSSCSASEALIVGLDPHRTATRVGETTCGKPVGFTPPTFGDNVYSIVTFRLRNAVGTTDYFDGLTPDCPVADDGAGQLGDRNEALTAAALAFLETGNCPAQGAQAIKALRDTRSLGEMTNHPTGLPALTNLW